MPGKSLDKIAASRVLFIVKFRRVALPSSRSNKAYLVIATNLETTNEALKVIVVIVTVYGRSPFYGLGMNPWV